MTELNRYVQFDQPVDGEVITFEINGSKITSRSTELNEDYKPFELKAIPKWQSWLLRISGIAFVAISGYFLYQDSGASENSGQLKVLDEPREIAVVQESPTVIPTATYYPCEWEHVPNSGATCADNPTATPEFEPMATYYPCDLDYIPVTGAQCLDNRTFGTILESHNID